MKDFKCIMMGILFSFVVGKDSFASQSRTFSNPVCYDRVREEGGFNSPTLSDVTELFPGGRNLDQLEIEELVTSRKLTDLRILDLTNQPAVNDGVIGRLVSNPTFSRIEKLILCGTDITDEAIACIASSPYLGGIRHYPNVSGKYGVPASEVRVYVKDTGVKDISQKLTFEFHIEFRPTHLFSYPWEPVDHGVRIVEITSW
jgi:hypothetical protein